MLHKVFRAIFGIAGGFVFLIFFIPFISKGIINIGNITGMVIALIWILYVIFLKATHRRLRAIWKKTAGKVCCSIILLVAAGVLITAIVATVMMLRAAHTTPEKEATVVVLGCGVNGETPSLMLQERLDAAYQYLSENKDAVAVLSGGQGPGEDISEAECMYRYLKDKGIDGDRLFREDKSTSTVENITFSKKIIEKEQLNFQIAVVTNEFHEYRASVIAKAQGLSFGAVPGKTAWWLFPTYYLRELYGIVYQWAGTLFDGGNSQNEYSYLDLMCVMAEMEDNRSSLAVALPDDYVYEMYCRDQYGFDDTLTAELEDGIIMYSMDGSATEYAAFKSKDKNRQEDIMDCYEKYVDRRLGVYEGYAPEEAAKLEGSVLFIKDDMVVLIVSEHAEAAKKQFEGVVTGKEVLSEYSDVVLSDIMENRKFSEDYYSGEDYDETQDMEDGTGNDKAQGMEDGTGNDKAQDTEKEISHQSSKTAEEILAENLKAEKESDIQDVDDSYYYNKDIVTAYREGNPQILKDEKDIKIYNRVCEILDSCVTEGMSPVEQEKAVHDYMCKNIDYDRKELSTLKTPMEDSDNPYGVLSTGFGICSGYASTFNLFMECLGIKCFVVEGLSNNFSEPHAWNMVEIDGEWCYVDVTWDDPVTFDGSTDPIMESDEQTEWEPTYLYFNCSEKTLREHVHHWNDAIYETYRQ